VPNEAKISLDKSRPSGLSGVGEEVKIHELQYLTKWSVLGGREGEIWS
jgi:hypothetical protein